MAAGYTVLTLDKGSKFEKIIELTDSSNVPLNLTGYTGVCWAKRSYYLTAGATGMENMFSITTAVQVPETAGLVKLSMTSAQTSLLTPGRYVFYVNLTVGGETERYIDGILIVNPS